MARWRGTGPGGTFSRRQKLVRRGAAVVGAVGASYGAGLVGAATRGVASGAHDVFHALKRADEAGQGYLGLAHPNVRAAAVAGSNRGTRAGFKHGIASGLLAVAVGHHIAAKNPGNPEQRRKAARAAIGIATVGPVITGVAGSALRSTRLFQKSARALQGKTTALRHLAAMMQAKRALKTAKVASKFVM